MTILNSSSQFGTIAEVQLSRITWKKLTKHSIMQVKYYFWYHIHALWPDFYFYYCWHDLNSSVFFCLRCFRHHQQRLTILMCVIEDVKKDYFSCCVEIVLTWLIDPSPTNFLKEFLPEVLLFLQKGCLLFIFTGDLNSLNTSDNIKQWVELFLTNGNKFVPMNETW